MILKMSAVAILSREHCFKPPGYDSNTKMLYIRSQQSIPVCHFYNEDVWHNICFMEIQVYIHFALSVFCYDYVLVNFTHIHQGCFITMTLFP